MKNIKTQKGITLIALVITIIVMLILVGVTISMAISGGLFGYAKKAAKDTESQKQAEQELASGKVMVNGKEYDSINAYLESMEEVLKENTPYVSDGKTAMIPKGFKIIADENGKKSIDAGLVIQDEVGNEYVWVPVEDGILDRTEWSNNEPTGTISSDYTETLPDDLVNSITINKGFYIGRYEAGCKDNPRTSGEDTLTDVLTQKGLYPYNCVSQKNAVDQTAKMYTDKTKYGVVATLPYGAMWDETLRFIKDDAHNVTDSTNWGNYGNHKFTFSGKYSSNDGRTWSEEKNNEQKPGGTGNNYTFWLLTTGASKENKAKNIYDLAGNVIEFTQELQRTNPVIRGDVFGAVSYVHPVSARYSVPESFTNAAIGFRPALYIK